MWQKWNRIFLVWDSCGWQEPHYHALGLIYINSVRNTLTPRHCRFYLRQTEKNFATYQRFQLYAIYRKILEFSFLLCFYFNLADQTIWCSQQLCTIPLPWTLLGTSRFLLPRSFYHVVLPCPTLIKHFQLKNW